MNINTNHKIKIIIAVIGVVGAIISAIITSWDKFSHKQSTEITKSVTSTDHDLPIPGLQPKKFLGALEGIYEDAGSNNQLSFEWSKRTYALTIGNCSLYGNLVEKDFYWTVVALGVDGICSIIDDIYIGKEVGKIHPVKGALANSGRVMKFQINFDISSLASISGHYDFKYNDVNELRWTLHGNFME